jgi:choline dehydrogenase
MAYDYIIIGTGAGGSVLADRLSRSGDYNVLVLEAGGSDWDPMHRIPKGFYFTMQNPRNTRGLTTQPFGDGTTETWQRGWLTGGSTTINGAVWNRGDPQAFDLWEERGNVGWNYQRFLEAWKQIEGHELGANEHRGGRGPVRVEVAKVANDVSSAVMKTLEDAGLKRVEDMNSPVGDRVSPVTSNTRRGFRRSAAMTFLSPARRRKNVTVRNHAEVTRILFSDKTAIGVEVQTEGRLERILAAREVLVCGGALESPLILERSGIGDPAVLRAAAVDVLVESPKVGNNLSEHRGIMFQYRFDGTVGFNHLINTMPRQMVTGVRYLLSGKGVLSIGGYDVSAIFRSDPDASAPDTQFLFTPISTSQSKPQDKGGMKVDDFSGGMIVAYPLYPTSRGSIHITGPRITDTPKLVPNYLDTDEDRDITVKMTRRVREIMSGPALQALGIEELVPGPDALSTDDEIIHYALNVGANAYHPLGTCGIGPEADDVVDNRLRVRGVRGLRVVDASVFPAQPSGNNSAPTQAAAWIAADMILEDARHMVPAGA